MSGVPGAKGRAPTSNAALELHKEDGRQFLAGASPPETSDRKRRLALAQAPSAAPAPCSDG